MFRLIFRHGLIIARRSIMYQILIINKKNLSQKNKVSFISDQMVLAIENNFKVYFGAYALNKLYKT